MKLNVITLILLACVFTGKASSRRFQQLKSTGLSLNKGAKWKVDYVTAANVSALQHIARSIDPSGKPNLSAYLKTGKRLQAGIVKMIRECHMKGPDHLALHHWLEPLMEKVVALNKVANAADAAKALSSVQDQLSLFDRYFKSDDCNG